MDKSFIGKRITQLRMRHNISEYQMSLELGKGKSYIQTITAGKSYPSVKELFNICDYFGITLSEFFDENNQEPETIKKIITTAKTLNYHDLKLLESLAVRLSPNMGDGNQS